MKKLVLFICSGNTCRSPMAKGLFIKQLEERSPELKDKIEVITAGTYPNPGDTASPGAREVMEEIGIDISDHRARPVTEEMLEAADLILTMTGAHRDYLTRIYGQNDKIHSLHEFLGQEGDVLDPYGGDTDTYRACRDELRQLLEMLVDKLENELL